MTEGAMPVERDLPAELALERRIAADAAQPSSLGQILDKLASYDDRDAFLAFHPRAVKGSPNQALLTALRRVDVMQEATGVLAIGDTLALVREARDGGMYGLGRD